MPYRESYLEEIIALERGPTSGTDSVIGLECEVCRVQIPLQEDPAQQNRAYRCDDCFGIPTLCSTCILLRHQSNPYHRIKVSLVTNRRYF